MGQGAGWGLVPWLEDAPEDPLLGGGVPYCPWRGGPWGEHGVCPFDEPLRAGGRSRSAYHVVVPALEDCNPDLRRGVVTVCRWGGRSSSGVRRPAAQRAVSRVGAVACSHCSGRFGSAGWSFSAGARRRRTVPRRVTLMSVFVCQGLAPLDGGDPDVLALGVFAGSPEYEVYDGLVEAVAWGGQVAEGFDGELGPVLL